MNSEHSPSRRELLLGAAAVGITPHLGKPANSAMLKSKTFVDLNDQPDYAVLQGADGPILLARTDSGWSGGGVELTFKAGKVAIRSSVGLVRLQLRWRHDLRAVRLVLGDHWERSYGDLAWRGKEAVRLLPWYCLAFDGEATHGYGVQTGPGAMIAWTLDDEGISLWADLRNGGQPVELGDRTLEVCQIISREGQPGESGFAAGHALCKQLCPKPLLVPHTLYGTNDWNFAYGKNSAELIAQVSGTISELSPSASNRPYSVIDDGWSQGGLGYGPWLGNDKFGDMGKMADRIRDLGARPGLWFRPLTPLKDMPETLRSRKDRPYLDPTLPEVKEHISLHMKRFADWGYEMIKHDFTTFDLFGRWGPQMFPSITPDGWGFHDRSKTSAEVVLDLYRTIRESAGTMKLLGCNTFSHLAAGLHEAQRTGDDTSGVSWHRTRKMGINTLAFRAMHHNTLYAVDPDIVAATKDIPWSLTEQWMNLVAESGTMLFLSVDPEFVTADHRAKIRRALDLAAVQQPIGEPLDWMQTDTPTQWRFGNRTDSFHWGGASGPSPFEG